MKKNTLEVLLVTTRHRKGWTLPKGQVEAGMTPWDSAAKEAWEEAGIRGVVGTSCLGRYTYKKRGRVHRVEVFPMDAIEVLDRWPEKSRRRRKWMPFVKAAGKVRHRSLGKLLKKLKDVV